MRKLAKEIHYESNNKNKVLKLKFVNNEKDIFYIDNGNSCK